MKANAAMKWKEEGLSLLRPGEELCRLRETAKAGVAQEMPLREKKNDCPALFPTAAGAWRKHGEHQVNILFLRANPT